VTIMSGSLHSGKAEMESQAIIELLETIALLLLLCFIQLCALTVCGWMIHSNMKD